MKKEEIDLLSRTKSFALRIIRLSSTLGSKSREAKVIGNQLLRSGTSIGANYREAYRSRSKAEFTSTIGICLKEAEETAYWLELLVESGLVEKEKLKQIIQETDELIAIFVTIRKSSKKNS
ncbi:MAG: four helix bundle protein [Verrucomicrobiota bacterium]